MPAKSKAQQRFFGMVHAYQKGKLKNASSSIKKAASSIDPDDAKDFAKTDTKDLPDKVKESIRKIVEAEIISQFDTNVKLRVDLKATDHAHDRQSRHTGRFIHNDEIISACKKAFTAIVSRLLRNTLDVGDEFVIKDTSNDLNVVAVVQPKGNDNTFVIRVITVMIKRDFKTRTTVIRVR